MSNAAQARMIQMGFMASGRRRSFLLFMKNTRRKRRFENRQNKRKKNFPTESDDFEKIFSHDHLFDAYRKCRRSVGWKLCRKAVARQRRRIKKLFKKVEEGKLSLNDVQQSYLSHRAYLKGFTAYRTRQAEDRLFKSLWREYASQIKK